LRAAAGAKESSGKPSAGVVYQAAVDF